MMLHIENPWDILETQSTAVTDAVERKDTMTKTLHIQKYINDPDITRISELAKKIANEIRSSSWYDSEARSFKLISLVDELYTLRTKDHLTECINDLYDLAYERGVTID